MKPSILERNVVLLFSRSYRMERASPALRARIAASLDALHAARATHSVSAPVPSRWRPAIAIAASVFFVVLCAAAWLVWRASDARQGASPLVADGRASVRVGDGSWRTLTDAEVRAGIEVEQETLELKTAAQATARLWLGASGRIDLLASSEIRVDARRSPNDLDIDLVHGGLELERYAAGGAWTVKSAHGDVTLERGAVKIAHTSTGEVANTSTAEFATTSIASLETDRELLCARLVRGAGALVAGADTVALAVDLPACLLRGRVVGEVPTVAMGSARESGLGATDEAKVEPTAVDATPTHARLRGKVESGDEVPAQVTVTLLRHERLPKVSEPRVRTCTLSNGAFDVDEIPLGTYRVCVAAAGYALWQIPELEVSADVPMRELTVRLERGARIRGRVVDARTREPLANALVLSERDTPVHVLAFDLEDGPSPTWPAWARTETDGTFEIAHSSFGKHILRATHRGFAAAWSSPVDVAREADEAEVFLQLDQGSVVHGHVADDEGAPWPGAVIIASIMDMSFDRPCLSFGHAIADAEGAYRIDDLPIGAYVILNGSRTDESSDEDASSFVSSARIARPGTTVKVDLPGASEGTRFLGRLVTADGTPRASLDVSLQRVGNRDSAGWLAARSTTDGSFQFARVEPGEYDLYVGENLGAHFVYQCTVDVPRVPDFRYEVRLATGRLVVRALDARTNRSPGECAVILARLTDAGEEFAGRFITAADGEARIDHLPDGIYRASVFALRGRYGPQTSAELYLRPDQRDAAIDIALHPGAALRVVVLDAHGRGIARANVKFTDGAGESMQHTADDTTDNNGRLHVQGMQPGRWTVVVEHAGHRVHTTVVDLEAGDERELALQLEPLEAVH